MCTFLPVTLHGIYFYSLTYTQKYLHESRHRHALNRLRGFSGRFSGKEQSQSPHKSPETPSGGSLPPTRPLAVQNPDRVGSNEQASGAELFPSELTDHYRAVTSIADLTRSVVHNIQVSPEMCTGSSLHSQAVSLALNQLNQPSVVPTVPSGGDGRQLQSLGDATIQGLINATHSFTVPVLPPLSSDTVTSDTADTTLSLITNPQISVQPNQVDINAVSGSLLGVGETLPINAISTAPSTNVDSGVYQSGTTHSNEQL